MARDTESARYDGLADWYDAQWTLLYTGTTFCATTWGLASIPVWTSVAVLAET